jgi:hypothetical protein
MERRKFFGTGAALTAGVALTAAGVVAGRAAPPAAAGKSSASIFDFGAHGDGVTDDSAAFSQALQTAASRGLVVIVPGFTYAIAKPIRFVSTGNVGTAWGLECQGATLLSRIDNGDDVMSLTSKNTVRYFRLTGGLSIKGSGADGNGLHCFAAGGSVWFYNFVIDGLSVERCGKNGLLVAGNCFESTVQNSYFQDNKKDGAVFAHSQGGVCSAITVVNSYFNQNGRYGLSSTDLERPYGGTIDVRVYGGYCRQNGSFGMYYNNGMGQGGLTQVGFENNCTSLKPGDPKGAHVYSQGPCVASHCTGYNEFGGATYFARVFGFGISVLDVCGQAAGGAMEASGKSKLLQADGKTGSKFVLRSCTGGYDKINPGVTVTETT